LSDLNISEPLIEGHFKEQLPAPFGSLVSVLIPHDTLAAAASIKLGCWIHLRNVLVRDRTVELNPLTPFASSIANDGQEPSVVRAHLDMTNAPSPCVTVVTHASPILTTVCG
jgi:hypothetical protein